MIKKVHPKIMNKGERLLPMTIKRVDYVPHVIPVNVVVRNFNTEDVIYALHTTFDSAEVLAFIRELIHEEIRNLQLSTKKEFIELLQKDLIDIEGDLIIQTLQEESKLR